MEETVSSKSRSMYSVYYRDVNTVGARIRNALARSRVAAASSKHRRRHGAVLFKGAKIKNVGLNSYRQAGWVRFNRDRDFEDAPCTMHAEINAMHMVDRGIIKTCSMAVVRLKKCGNLALSKPCSTCRKEMWVRGVARCYFSVDNDTIGVLIRN